MLSQKNKKYYLGVVALKEIGGMIMEFCSWINGFEFVQRNLFCI